ncbi:ATP-binding protein [Gilvibacter sediminis]|uniref:ATP-binding protein n=1 Tax=Gilvibacter sediminis TaxID=379071 RepID=UPI0023508B6A|nr:ATP-binding protein [Gilvibacter sediminis]MDC7997177.1 ATP-binding protein [Gilvibacter sediminis]
MFKQEHSQLIKIAVVGPESTGKTTLVKALASHFETTYVPEFMRTYYEELVVRDPFYSEIEDILPIAQGQIEAENTALKTASELLICDTNLLEIACYSKYYFDEIPPLLEASLPHMQYDLCFLTYIDVPWENDPLRDRPFDRQKVFSIFEERLKAQAYPHLVLKGDEQVRLQTAIRAIEKYREGLHGI